MDRIVALKMISREQASVVQRVRFQSKSSPWPSWIILTSSKFIRSMSTMACPIFLSNMSREAVSTGSWAGYHNRRIRQQLLETWLVRSSRHIGGYHRDLKPANILLTAMVGRKSPISAGKQIEQESYQTGGTCWEPPPTWLRSRRWARRIRLDRSPMSMLWV